MQMFGLVCCGEKLSCVLLLPVSSSVLECSSLLNDMNAPASAEEVTADAGACDHGQGVDEVIVVGMLT